MGWGALLAGDEATELELEPEGIGAGLKGLSELTTVLEGRVVGGLPSGLGELLEGMGEEGTAGGLTQVGRGPGLDSTGGWGMFVGYPGFGPPGVEQDSMVLISVTVSVTVIYEIAGEELGPLGIETTGEELGWFGTVWDGRMQLFGGVSYFERGE